MTKTQSIMKLFNYWNHFYQQGLNGLIKSILERFQKLSQLLLNGVTQFINIIKNHK